MTRLQLKLASSSESVPAQVVQVFDKNGDRIVDSSEWPAPFGSLGPNGEAVKSYVFK